MNLRKILLSVFSIGVVALVAVFATNAFFSDTEESIDNVFVAGALDLKIDNESYATDCTIPEDPELNPNPSCTGALVASAHTSWDLTDLTDELFFDFIDLKPGDFGEDTISIHVDNDAWLCMDWNTTSTPENTHLQPEIDDGDNTDDVGELQNFIEFVWWVDDGDNVLEEDEVGEEDELVLFSGTLADMDGFSVALADSSNESVTGGLPIPGTDDIEEVFFIGKAWCFGELTLEPRNPEEGDEGPDHPDRGPGVLCDGEPVDNTPQTDSVHGDMSFSAEQARHNPDFLCNPPTRIVRTQEGFGDGGWAGWSCPAGKTVVGGGIISSDNPVGGSGMAKPGEPAVDGFTYPIYPHHTFGVGETGFVVHDFPGDGLGNTITFHLDCL